MNYIHHGTLIDVLDYVALIKSQANTVNYVDSKAYLVKKSRQLKSVRINQSKSNIKSYNLKMMQR